MVELSVRLRCRSTLKDRDQKGSKMIEAAKVIVPFGQGEEVKARAIAAGLQAFTESYREDSVDEVIVEAEDETNLFEESIVVQAIGDTQYSEVQVFVPDSLMLSAKARMQELGIPDARQLSEREWAPGATYETMY
jgi:hypothetical protein